MQFAVWNRHHTVIFVGMALLGLCSLVIMFTEFSCSISINDRAKDSSNILLKNESTWGGVTGKGLDLQSPHGLMYEQPSVTQGRTDVVTVTPWLGPIVWEGTFDPVVVDGIFKPLNLTIATTVFALGKYLRFLRPFLETAEQHYLLGFCVHYHIFTDQPQDVPLIPLAAGRELSVHQVPKFDRWQDISAGRMQMIQQLIEERLLREADYLFCLDVDTTFRWRWGSEVLSRLVGQIHPWFYDQPRHVFTYERRPESQAYIPKEEGDYYYIGAVFGGLVPDVYELVRTCRQWLEADRANEIEAAWQEESHLNKYLLYNKPTKVLSPEYLWHDARGVTSHIRVVRFSQVLKNYADVRENV